MMSHNADDYKLIAKLGSLRTVVHLLKAINFKEVNTDNACPILTYFICIMSLSFGFLVCYMFCNRKWIKSNS